MLMTALGSPAHGTGSPLKKEIDQHSPPVGPAEITLKTETGKKPAMLPHAKHQAKFDCDTCHKNANFPTDKKWSLKQGHGLCMSCHKARNEGPTKCNNACHE
jgi:predicted CXXCH cytochrome family protein